jgi:glycosyltransferase involved in cell wall biosynthesis
MIIIVQPWFAAIGHPAQSLLNTAKIIGYSKDIRYLVSYEAKNSIFSETIISLKMYGEIIRYKVKTRSLFEGTFKAVLRLKYSLVKDLSIDRVFFFDADLILLSGIWGLFFSQKKSPHLGVIYLHGPERIQRHRFIAFMVKRFLLKPNITLFLRTDELLEVWRMFYPNANLKRLPTMEIPAEEVNIPIDEQKSSKLRFGILGQIREGKGLDWIVPFFDKNKELGELTIAGEFASKEHKITLDFLINFKGFVNKYLTEQELLAQAVKQDYLLMLYDNWDERLEGAIMYLAARVNRPVIVYEGGWCGRMVATYKNGIVISKRNDSFLETIASLPKPHTDEYETLLEGVQAFKSDHSGKVIRDAFLDTMKFY